MLLGLIFSLLLWFYGVLIRMQDWEGEFEFYLEQSCINIGIIGMIIFSLLSLYNHIKENRKLKEKA